MSVLDPSPELQVNRPASPRNLIATALDWQQQGKRVALITLVNIEGNAPYPIGSQMLVSEHGEFAGQITGGCAETALADQAVAAIGQQENQTQRYGLDSPFFDIQLPCGSGIDVFIDTGLTVVQLEDINQELSARRAVQQTLDTGVGRFVKTYLPNERLLIFGQGPILHNLAQLAHLSGFETICFAQDESNLQALQDSGIQANLLRHHAQQFTGAADRFSGLVSLFHEHDLETDILAQALQTDLFYIGALGSRRTHAARLEALKMLGVDQSALERIHGPVGVKIGANTPAQIAVSIIAEAIQCLPDDG